MKRARRRASLLADLAPDGKREAMNVAATWASRRSSPKRRAPPSARRRHSALSRAAFSWPASVRLRRPRLFLRPRAASFALYRLVENGRFIAVIGSSGSGKSSLVLAGLQGLLAEESADPGGPKWVCLDMRPGGLPLPRLAKALARLAEKDNPDETARRSERIECRLRQSSFSFESALKEAGGLGGRTLSLSSISSRSCSASAWPAAVRRGGIEEAARATKQPSSCRSC